MKEAPSPDGAAHAYLVRSNPGAMSSFIYTVRLGPAGVDPMAARVIIRGARMEGLDFAWQGPRELKVHVPCGRFSEVTNFLGDARSNLWVDVFFEFEKLNCHGSARPG